MLSSVSDKKLSGNLEFSTTFPENLSKSLNLSVSEYPHVESEGKQDPGV